MPLGTALSPIDEKGFQEFFAALAKNRNWNPNPDDPAHAYDMRGYYQLAPPQDIREVLFNRDLHFPDTWKLPNHPTFSTESKYYRPNMKAGTWEGENYIPMKPEDYIFSTFSPEGW